MPTILTPGGVEKLVERAGWTFDAFVVRAYYVITAAKISAVETRDAQKLQDEAVAAAVAYLSKAQVAGSPYYSYTNQLFAEVVVGIAEYFRESKARFQPATVNKFDRLYSRWHRELPLQRGAGLTFTWLARDLDVLKSDKLLVPKRDVSGRLRQSHTAIIFEGQVSAGNIEIIGGGPNSFQPLSDDDTFLSSVVEPEYQLSQMPSLGRILGPDDDPNLGRFGGQSSLDGFHLTATFEPTEPRDWVTIILTLEAERSAMIGIGDFAWFLLHPTFSPSAI
ncbi:hypothetical protein QN375_16660 [Pseudomonas sp. MH9.2]|uniref:hypothetical protein n=1 Tax=unclassified Pseudomonas TaxID=196821 RepID=UPI002AC94143|nr:MULTISPECIES: hypothetical protein [unclassified Pseudomonas]MEB0027390.1 hypothetical protein [Pseudomonas sp. MH9.2]MEE3506608.1 hypothetical protein [Pseudomonas sp. 10C3]WPX68805.1 hypothetical protein RHM55_24395 [Pseudomonas sp. MH9.2]